MLFGAEMRQLGPQRAAHPEMNANPAAAGEFEKHLFAVRGGTEQASAGKPAPKRARSSAAKDAFSRMQLDRDDPGAEPRVPLLAIIFDFCQLWHFGEGR